MRRAAARKLWEFDAQTGIIAAPITYEVDGEQYVTVLAGWGGAAPNAAGEIVDGGRQGRHQPRADLQARREGSAAAARPSRGRSTRRPTPPTKEAFERGLDLYQVNCMICHGDTAVSGGVVPDLRYSATLGAPDAWKSIVVDGSLVNNGMVPFADILSPTRSRPSAPMWSSARMTRRHGLAAQ